MEAVRILQLVAVEVEGEDPETVVDQGMESDHSEARNLGEDASMEHPVAGAVAEEEDHRERIGVPNVEILIVEVVDGSFFDAYFAYSHLNLSEMVVAGR